MDYPPLAPVDKYPMHPAGVYPEESVWACTVPERPATDLTAYDWRCRSCVLAAQAHVLVCGDEEIMWQPTAGAERVPKTLSWMVARSLALGVL